MKRSFFFILLFISVTVNAQNWQASLGPQLSFPSGDLKGLKTGIGFGLEVAKPIKAKGAITAAFAFNDFATKGGGAYNDPVIHLGFVTARVGYRTTAVLGKPYIGLDAGIVFLTQDFTPTNGFTYSIGPGYLLRINNKSFVDISLRYNNTSPDTRKFQWFALRAAFGLNFLGSGKK